MLEILPDDPVKAGEIVANRYRLDRIVGEGGMGVVWAATHVLTEKPCALKFLKANRATDPRSHSRLLHEARATCRVRHPNVAPVHDILELPNGVPFIVMDLLDGEPLSALLRRAGSLDWQTTLEILAPTTDAIMAAHEQGVVHRDLKPDNVFLERAAQGGYEIKVLDFGIAKRFDLAHVDRLPDEPAPPVVRASQGLTTTNSAIGTPSYMAPEQIRHDADVGKAADVWMLGMLAYECLTGERPARDASTDGIATTIAKVHLDARGLAAPATALVMSMLALDPADRPALDHVRAEMRAFGAVAPRKKYGAAFVVAGAAAVALVAFSIASREGPRTAVASTTVNSAPSALATPTTAENPVAVATTSASALPVASSAGSTHSPVALAPSSEIAKKSARVTASAPSASAIAPSAPSSNIVIPSYERK